MSPAYAKLLQALCPSNSTRFTPITTGLDVISPGVLDNKYYVGLTNSLSLLTSDHALLTDANLSAAVSRFATHQSAWESKFTKAMVRMGEIQVLTGTEGQIRLNCRVVNNASTTAAAAAATGFGSVVGSSHYTAGGVATI